jgi:hypothetical protein
MSNSVRNCGALWGTILMCKMHVCEFTQLPLAARRMYLRRVRKSRKYAPYAAL